MQLMIDIDQGIAEGIVLYERIPKDYENTVIDALRNGTPLPEHVVLEKIKAEISRYELDCRFADYSQTDECTICNKNVFGSIYNIIDKYIEGSDSK